MKDRQQLFDSILRKVDEILREPMDKPKRLETICELLKNEVPHYTWVGFYLVDPAKPDELVLGPFKGTPTEHIRIAFGKGICGQAAAKKSTLTIQDVSKETNYLACSPFVKSEMVVPIFKNSTVIGELDIDSHEIAAFTDEDRIFLEQICELLSNYVF